MADTEETPLITPVASHPTRQLEHSESIHTYIVLCPEYARSKYGHYCFRQVFVAYALFFLTIILRVSFTEIAGKHILRASVDFRTSLVTHGDQRSWYSEDPVESISQSAMSTKDHLVDVLNSHVKKQRHSCCSGMHCASGGRPCCEKRNISNLEEGGDVEWGVVVETPSRTGLFGFLKPKNRHREDLENEQTNRAGALCTLKGNHVDCAPQSFRFIDAWRELDINGDGIWTYEEARIDHSNLGCRLGLDVEEIFRSVIQSIEIHVANSRGEFMASKVRSQRNSVPHKYFDVWRGLVAICMAPSEGRCGSMIRAGVFDGLLSSDRNGLAQGRTLGWSDELLCTDAAAQWFA